MKADVQNIEAKSAGSVELSDAIFGLEPRQDILHRMVVWQLNKRQAGTHKTKGRAEINRTGKKLGKQKGGGGVTASLECVQRGNSPYSNETLGVAPGADVDDDGV